MGVRSRLDPSLLVVVQAIKTSTPSHIVQHTAYGAVFQCWANSDALPVSHPVPRRTTLALTCNWAVGGFDPVLTFFSLSFPLLCLPGTPLSITRMIRCEQRRSIFLFGSFVCNSPSLKIQDTSQRKRDGEKESLTSYLSLHCIHSGLAIFFSRLGDWRGDGPTRRTRSSSSETSGK